MDNSLDFLEEYRTVFKIGVCWVWLRWSLFSHSSPHRAVLCVGSWKGAANPAVVWVLLGRAGTAAAMLSFNIPPPSRGWKGTQAGQLSQKDN